MIDQVPQDIFWYWMQERWKIFQKKSANFSWPWTNDPILQEYSFTNVHRENDKTTVWFRENIREPQRNQGRVFENTIIFRWFNRIETGERLLRHNLFDDWDAQRCLDKLSEYSPPHVTGAYITNTPRGYSKVEGVIRCIENALPTIKALAQVADDEGFTLQQLHIELDKIDFIGDFLAYEIVTDLTHTWVLENAEDRESWANAGPGAIRGLNRYFDRPVKTKLDQEQALSEMQYLLHRAQSKMAGTGATIGIREIEHSLCEYDKYMRVLNGEGRPRAKYGWRKTQT